MRFAKISPMQEKLAALDVDSIINCLTGQRNDNGIVKVDETVLEDYGKEDFGCFYEHVCEQNHVKDLALTTDMIVDPNLSHVVHRKFKLFLRDLIWNPKYIDILSACLVVENDGGKSVSFLDYLREEKKIPVEHVAEQVGLVTSFKTVNTNYFCLKNVYEMKSAIGNVNVSVNEENIYKSIYTDPDIFALLGKEVCICIDISLAKGGTEAIVESFYSSMKAQTKYGGQTTDTLALRTKLEWTLPPVLQAGKVISGTATVYLNGCKERNYKSHEWPTLGDASSAKYKISKVVDRIANEHVSLPFLL